MADTKAGNVYIDIQGNSAPFKQKLNNLPNETRGITASVESKFAALGKKISATLAGAFAVKAVVGFGKQCLELGSDLAEVQNVVDVTFPSMTAQIDAFAKNAAAKFGLSETMAKRYVGTFGSMAEAFGYTENEAASMAETLTGLSGDVASFYNISQDEAYTKLKSVFTGETESLKELGIVMTQTALDEYALANGFGAVTSQMTEAEKVSLRFSFVQSQLSNAAGDFARTSNSWANQVRLLALQFESLKAAIGQGLINVLTPVIKLINIFMAKLVQAAQVFSRFTSMLFGKTAATSVTKGTENLASGLSNVGTGGSNAAKGLGKANKAAKQLNRSIAGFDKITKLNEKQSGSGGGGAGGLGGLGGGAAGLALPMDGSESSKVDDLLKKYPALAKALTNLSKALKPLNAIMSKFGGWLVKNVLKPFGKWLINSVVPNVINLIASAVRFLVSVLRLLGVILKPLWNKILKPLFKALGKQIVNNIKSMSSAFNVLAKIVDPIRKNIEKLKSLLADGFEHVDLPDLSDIKTNVEAVIVNKTDEFKKQWEELVAPVKSITASMKAAVASKWDDIKTAWTNITGNIKDKTASMKVAIGSKWSDLKNSWSNLLAKFKGKKVTVSLALKASVSSLKSWVNTNVIGKINSAIHKVPLFKGVNVPKLAQGGFVKANTPQLAMIGDNKREGEIVAPESKLEAMAQKAAQGGSNAEIIALLRQIVAALNSLDLTANVSGRELADLVISVINGRTKATGKSPLVL